MDEKRGIGKDNKIPWHIVPDLLRLKNLTKDQVVILGRNSYDSMVWYYDRSGREMPGRLYIIITSDKVYQPVRKNATVAHSLEEALEKAKGEEEVFINGGARVFNEAMEKGIVDRLYLTIVKGDFAADTFFSDYSNFTKVISEEEQTAGDYNYKFLTLER